MAVTIEPPPARTAPRRPAPGPPARNGKAKAEASFAQSKCGGCIALCCRYFALEIDRPQHPKDFDDLRWYLLHDRTAIFTEGRSWFVQIFNKCSWLGDDGRCLGYEQRPSICREYENDWCDYDETRGGDKEHDPDLTFHTVAELEAYRDRWVARWKVKDRKKRREAALRGIRRRKRALGR
jgi:Fe-S-cluster containining protein